MKNIVLLTTILILSLNFAAEAKNKPIETSKSLASAVDPDQLRQTAPLIHDKIDIPEKELYYAPTVVNFYYQDNSVATYSSDQYDFYVVLYPEVMAKLSEGQFLGFFLKKPRKNQGQDLIEWLMLFSVEEGQKIKNSGFNTILLQRTKENPETQIKQPDDNILIFEYPKPSPAVKPEKPKP